MENLPEDRAHLKESPMDNKSILIIDDEKDMCEMLQEILQLEGLTTEIVNSGREALERCSSNSYKIIIVDLLMGEMDGITTIKNLKDILPDTKFFVMTAYRDCPELDDKEKYGIVGVFYKPFSIEDFLNTLRQHIE